MSNTNEHKQTMLTLLRASANYVYKNIMSGEGRQAYKAAIDVCLSRIESEWDSMYALKQNIEDVKSLVDSMYKPSLFNRKTESRNYFLLGCQHAEDVVLSIEKRFITGGSGYYRPTASLEKHGDVLYDNNTVF